MEKLSLGDFSINDEVAKNKVATGITFEELLERDKKYNTKKEDIVPGK